MKYKKKRIRDGPELGVPIVRILGPNRGPRWPLWSCVTRWLWLMMHLPGWPSDLAIQPLGMPDLEGVWWFLELCTHWKVIKWWDARSYKGNNRVETQWDHSFHTAVLFSLVQNLYKPFCSAAFLLLGRQPLVHKMPIYRPFKINTNIFFS